MYNLPYFKEKNPETVHQFIKDYPFAFICGSDSNNFPVVTQAPVFIEEEGGKKYLRGHIMRNTDHHKAFVHNDNVLVVFNGAHVYVSATWYSNPNTASTWNYMSVHVKGKVRFLDEAALEGILQRTSLYFENNDPESPTVFDNLPSNFKEKMMPAIVAFEIEIAEMDNVFKLSQNRDRQSFLNIIEQLEQQDEDGQKIAAEMKKRISELYPDNG